MASALMNSKFCLMTLWMTAARMRASTTPGTSNRPPDTPAPAATKSLEARKVTVGDKQPCVCVFTFGCCVHADMFVVVCTQHDCGRSRPTPNAVVSQSADELTPQHFNCEI